MANQYTLEEALAKITALEGEKKAVVEENFQLKNKAEAMETELNQVKETSMETIKDLQEKLKDTEAQKAGQLPIKRITKGDHAGQYQFQSASFNLKGVSIKAIDVKNDSDILKLLVEKKSSVVQKI